jgi:peptide/nickel transport system permease protein
MSEQAFDVWERRTTKRAVYVRAFLSEPVTIAAWCIFILMLLFAAVGPEIYPHDPYAQSLSNRLQPPGTAAGEGLPPHFLGTDALGRDVAARLLSGARVSIAVGFAGVIVSGALGITIGLVAGYFRGRTEDFLMRLTDLQDSFPALIFALFVLYALGPSLVNLLVVLAIARWPTYARVARSLVLGLRDEQYIEGARALGSSPIRILYEHILPNARSPLAILATLELARVILFESTLSFLGFGIQPPDTSWGLMISEGREYLTRAPWLIVVPGLAIFATALSANLIASWGQSVTDPIRRAEWLRRGLRQEG